jgi:hypothetical protein
MRDRSAAYSNSLMDVRWGLLEQYTPEGTFSICQQCECGVTAILAEVTTDDRFTGGELVRSSRHEIQSWLSKYGIRFWRDL